MTTIDQNRLLQMRADIVGKNDALRRAVGAKGDATAINGSDNTGDANAVNGFSETMNEALQAVNSQQIKAGEMTAAYERGETNDIVGVMVERQKASLGFEATLQVRNKLLSAYRDIMNMPV